MSKKNFSKFIPLKQGDPEIVQGFVHQVREEKSFMGYSIIATDEAGDTSYFSFTTPKSIKIEKGSIIEVNGITYSKKAIDEDGDELYDDEGNTIYNHRIAQITHIKLIEKPKVHSGADILFEV